MALNIGTVNFNLDANTRGLQNATKQIEQFRKVVNAAARDTTKGGAATVNAYARQESATKRAFQQTLNLQRAIRSNVTNEQKRNAMLANSSNAFRILVKEMTSGVLKSHEFTRSIDAFNARLNRSSREVKNFKDNKLATTLGKWGLRFRELESSAVLAMGPLSGVGARFRALSALMSRTGTIMTAVAIGSITLLVTGLYKVAAASIKATMEVERLQARFKAAAGGDVKEGAENFRFVAKVADQLGLKILDLGKSYSRLTAATAGTALEGQHTRNIFVSVAEAAAALRLESVEVEGAFRAIEQMVSKGNVQAEELRGQLGERLPGAFRLAARAMDMTTRELDRALRKGSITANQMLPALARELHKTFGSEALDNVRSMQGDINNLSNSMLELKLAFAGATGATGLWKKALELATWAIQGLTKYIDAVKLPAAFVLEVFWGWVIVFKSVKIAAMSAFALITDSIALMIEGAVNFANLWQDIFTVDADELARKAEWLKEQISKAPSEGMRQRLRDDLERTQREYEEMLKKGAPEQIQMPDIVGELRGVGKEVATDMQQSIFDLYDFTRKSPFGEWWDELGKFNSLLGQTGDIWKDALDPDELSVSTAFDNLINKLNDAKQETEGYKEAMSAIAGVTDSIRVDALLDAIQELRKLGGRDDMEELAAYLEVDPGNMEAIRSALADIFENAERAGKEMDRFNRAQQRMPEIAREVADEFGRINESIKATRMGPQFVEIAETMAEISRKAERMRDKLEQGNFTPEQIEGVIAAYKELLQIQDEETRRAERFANLSQEFAERIGNAFSDAIFEGKKLSDVIKQLVQDIIRLALQKSVLDPFIDAMGAMFGAMMGGNTTGNTLGQIFTSVFSGKGLAKGGLTKGPTMFTKGGKTNVMGEAGTEAVMPLGRTSSGDLGVKVAGDGMGGDGDMRPIQVIQHFHFDVGLESVDARIAAAAPQIAASAQIGFSKALRRPKMA